jgi:hypothetical protein
MQKSAVWFAKLEEILKRSNWTVVYEVEFDESGV